MGYWDIPEEDCFGKTWFTTKMGTALGLVGSAYHIVAYQPDTAIQAVQRAANGTLTMATLGAIFGVTTCLTAEVREKPGDPLNYFVGGCASGLFLGVRSLALAPSWVGRFKKSYVFKKTLRCVTPGKRKWRGSWKNGEGPWKINGKKKTIEEV
ncbi:NDUAB dehydrogenase, partial [Polypterus senegalus]